jgi:DNA polymerase (family 10)
VARSASLLPGNSRTSSKPKKTRATSTPIPIGAMGKKSIETMIATAVERGLEYVATTDHSSGRVIGRGLSIDRLWEQGGVSDELRTRFPMIEILHGSEVDIRADGTLDFPDSVLAELDLVVALIHSEMGESSERMTARLIRPMENPFVTCIAHFSTRIIGERQPIAFDEDAVFRCAATTHTALEINAPPTRLGLRDTDAARARALGVPPLINTGSHSRRGFDALRFGIGVARRAWCAPNDIINTAPWPNFRDFLAAKCDMSPVPTVE